MGFFGSDIGTRLQRARNSTHNQYTKSTEHIGVSIASSGRDATARQEVAGDLVPSGRPPSYKSYRPRLVYDPAYKRRAESTNSGSTRFSVETRQTVMVPESAAGSTRRSGEPGPASASTQLPTASAAATARTCDTSRVEAGAGSLPSAMTQRSETVSPRGHDDQRLAQSAASTCSASTHATSFQSGSTRFSGQHEDGEPATPISVSRKLAMLRAKFCEIATRPATWPVPGKGEFPAVRTHGPTIKDGARQRVQGSGPEDEQSSADATNVSVSDGSDFPTIGREATVNSSKAFGFSCEGPHLLTRYGTIEELQDLQGAASAAAGSGRVHQVPSRQLTQPPTSQDMFDTSRASSGSRLNDWCNVNAGQVVQGSCREWQVQRKQCSEHSMDSVANMTADQLASALADSAEQRQSQDYFAGMAGYYRRPVPFGDPLQSWGLSGEGPASSTFLLGHRRHRAPDFLDDQVVSDT